MSNVLPSVPFSQPVDIELTIIDGAMHCSEQFGIARQRETLGALVGTMLPHAGKQLATAFVLPNLAYTLPFRYQAFPDFDMGRPLFEQLALQPTDKIQVLAFPDEAESELVTKACHKKHDTMTNLAETVQEKNIQRQQDQANLIAAMNLVEKFEVIITEIQAEQAREKAERAQEKKGFEARLAEAEARLAEAEAKRVKGEEDLKKAFKAEQAKGEKDLKKAFKAERAKGVKAFKAERAKGEEAFKAERVKGEEVLESRLNETFGARLAERVESEKALKAEWVKSEKALKEEIRLLTVGFYPLYIRRLLDKARDHTAALINETDWHTFSGRYPYEARKSHIQKELSSKNIITLTEDQADIICEGSIFRDQGNIVAHHATKKQIVEAIRSRESQTERDKLEWVFKYTYGHTISQTV